MNHCPHMEVSGRLIIWPPYKMTLFKNWDTMSKGRLREKALVSGPCGYALCRKQKPVLSLELWQELSDNSSVPLGMSSLLQVAYTIFLPNLYSGLGKSSVKSFLFILLHFQTSRYTSTSLKFDAEQTCLTTQHWPPKCSLLPWLQNGPTCTTTYWVKAVDALTPTPLQSWFSISAFHWISHIPFPFPADAEM